MKNLTILLSVCLMIVNGGQAQENVKVSNEDTLSVVNISMNLHYFGMKIP